VLIHQDSPQHIPPEGEIKMASQHPQASQGSIHGSIAPVEGEITVVTLAAIPIFQGFNLGRHRHDATGAFNPFRFEDICLALHRIWFDHHGRWHP
jgi:hypothetical protein